jgi:hypothetical protein
LVVALALVVSPAARALQPQAGGLKIVVLDGEDAVNVIQQRTAVQPLVEVRDRNNLPVAGAVVTFTIGGGGGAATFANQLTVLQVTTDAAGRAAAAGLQPVGSGAVNIQVSAAYQGQTASASITQTNFATAADAASAGRTPSSTQSANPSAASSGASGASGAAGAAGAGAAAGGAAATGGTGAATGGAAAGGAGAAGGGGLSGLAIGGIVAGGAVGGLVAAKAVGGSDPGDDNTPTAGPQCAAQEAAVTAEANALVSSVNTYVSCVTGATSPAQANACQTQFTTFFQRYLNVLSNYCTCLGPAATQELTADERRQVQEGFAQIRALGFNIGNVPACFQ